MWHPATKCPHPFFFFDDGAAFASSCVDLDFEVIGWWIHGVCVHPCISRSRSLATENQPRICSSLGAANQLLSPPVHSWSCPGGGGSIAAVDWSALRRNCKWTIGTEKRRRAFLFEPFCSFPNGGKNESFASSSACLTRVVKHAAKERTLWVCLFSFLVVSSLPKDVRNC